MQHGSSCYLAVLVGFLDDVRSIQRAELLRLLDPPGDVLGQKVEWQAALQQQDVVKLTQVESVSQMVLGLLS